MGIIMYDMTVSSSISPAKMFKAFILDGDSLIPKILPQAIESVEILEGDGGAGTIKLTTFGEGSQFTSVKHRVDELDTESFTCKYSTVEGDALMGVLESISYVIKIEESPEGGSVCQTSSTYYTKGDIQITEEQIKSGKEKALAMFKAVEAYPLANPDAYDYLLPQSSEHK